MEILGDFLSEIESLKKRISTLEESVVAMKAEMESAPVETPSEPVSEDVDIDIDIVDIPESEPEEPVAPVEVDLPLAEPELPVASEAAEPESEIEVKPLPVPESEPKSRSRRSTAAMPGRVPSRECQSRTFAVLFPFSTERFSSIPSSKRTILSMTRRSASSTRSPLSLKQLTISLLTSRIGIWLLMLSTVS